MHSALFGPCIQRWNEPPAKFIIERIDKDGVEFDMCANTMKAKNLELKDLLPGFVKAENGGVVRIAQLQQQGYV